MVTERVIRIMEGILQRDVDHLLTLDAEGGVTPLDVARFVIACEHAFDVKIMDENAAAWQTLEDACLTIEGVIEAGDAGKAIREDDERTGWFYT